MWRPRLSIGSPKRRTSRRYWGRARSKGRAVRRTSGTVEARPRIISDNGPQVIAKDFKEFIRISGMTHVRTSPFYPQSNGKIERWQKSLKGECIRPGTPLSLEDARRLVSGYVDHLFADHTGVDASSNDRSIVVGLRYRAPW